MKNKIWEKQFLEVPLNNTLIIQLDAISLLYKYCQPMQYISPFIVSVASIKLTQAEREVLRSLNPLGVIIFGRNVQDKAQVKNLIRDLKSCLTRKNGDKIPILVDVEGGLVNRLKKLDKGQYDYPSQKKYGDLAVKSSLQDAKDELEQNITRMSKDILELGINTNCAPVLDLRHRNTAGFLASRIFSDDIKIVKGLSILEAQVLYKQGIVPVIKHIPGHGRATSDSHENLPIVTTSIKDLEVTDFEIFKTFDKVKISSMGMVGHVCYKSIDPISPATQSKKVVRYIKDNLFSGILISDDINMQALSGSIYERADRILDAGVDVVLYGSGQLHEMKALSQLHKDKKTYLSEEKVSQINALYSKNLSCSITTIDFILLISLSLLFPLLRKYKKLRRQKA